MLSPIDFEAKAEPYPLEISPKQKLPSHFFIHKGEEIRYLLSGRLPVEPVELEKAVCSLRAGALIYLTAENPTQWVNPGPALAKPLWIKVR